MSIKNSFTQSQPNQATPLLLLTKDPSHPLAELALRYAQALLIATVDVPNSNNEAESDKKISGDTFDDNSAKLNIFFYANAAHTANRLRWQSADQTDLTKQWQKLAKSNGFSLPVCVSTALSRGVSDSENSARHQLTSANLADGFELVGLSELAMMMQSDCRLIVF